MEKEKWNKIGIRKMILLAVAGIILIGISYVDIGSRKKTTQTEEVSTKNENDYVTAMEDKVSDLLNSMSGISDVKVVITLKAGSEKIVKEDMESSKKTKEGQDSSESEENSKKTTVILNGDDADFPYVIKEIYPQVQGIAVSAKGIADVETKNKIINMLAALFDVPIHKISLIEN